MPDTLTIHEAAPRIVAAVHANGFPLDHSYRQLLILGEEAGEFLGAYRRYTGRARRSGTWEEVCEELADVVITAYVTAEEMGRPLDRIVGPVLPREPAAVLVQVGRVLAHGMDGVHDHRSRTNVWFYLDRAVIACYGVALRLGIDLDQAVSDKLHRIFTRGWREQSNA